MSPLEPEREVFSNAEVARAAGVDVSIVDRLIAAGRIPSVNGFVPGRDAVAAVRALREGSGIAAEPAGLFYAGPGPRREPGLPTAVTALTHFLILGAAALLATTATSAGPVPVRAMDTTRLVFLNQPGPGGGGGGGGRQEPRPPARAKRAGDRSLRSPVPKPAVPGPEQAPRPERPPDPRPTPAPPDPVPAQEPEPAPPIEAPVATSAADDNNQAGIPDDRPASPDQGPGTGGGAGTGRGTGMGEGTGNGIGEGTGGGTGGGPYRPGAGITPPSLVREVKPDYTEEARQRGLTGEVELEIVVRSDGSVGSVRLVRGLGSGLDQRAIDAVRQWRFTPARRFGTPVDVLVQVAVEFRIR
jgi:TonB family protein